MGGRAITVIDGSAFLRECIRRSLQSAFNLRVLTYSDASDFQKNKTEESSIIIFSYGPNIDKDEFADSLAKLREIEPDASIIVLGCRLDLVEAAVRAGVRGYIPVTLEFQVVIRAVRVILAGGTYMPLDSLLVPAPIEELHETTVTLTSREISVIRAIRLGKSNKIIAYNLGMTENTVKVHVRHIMSKLKAKNRTEIAMISDKYIYEND